MFPFGKHTELNNSWGMPISILHILAHSWWPVNTKKMFGKPPEESYCGFPFLKHMVWEQNLSHRLTYLNTWLLDADPLFKESCWRKYVTEGGLPEYRCNVTNLVPALATMQSLVAIMSLSPWWKTSQRSFHLHPMVPPNQTPSKYPSPNISYLRLFYQGILSQQKERN